MHVFIHATGGRTCDALTSRQEVTRHENNKSTSILLFENLFISNRCRRVWVKLYRIRASSFECRDNADVLGIRFWYSRDHRQIIPHLHHPPSWITKLLHGSIRAGHESIYHFLHSDHSHHDVMEKCKNLPVQVEKAVVRCIDEPVSCNMNWAALLKWAQGETYQSVHYSAPC